MNIKQGSSEKEKIKKILDSYKNDPCKFMENYLLKNLNHKEEENIMTNTNKEISYKMGEIVFKKLQPNNTLERKIEYRAWDINQKKMRKVVGLDFLNDEIEYVDDDNEKIYHFKTGSNNIILMQYIGLKDVYGKRIFEGDIVKCEDEESDITCKVIFSDNARFLLKWNDPEWKYNYYFELDSFSLKIIGNIYENPELLKEKKNDL